MYTIAGSYVTAKLIITQNRKEHRFEKRAYVNMVNYLKKESFILWLVFAIICLISVTCSPRFGYQLTGANTVFELTGIEKEAGYTTASYEEKNGNMITLAYTQRFLGELAIGYNQDEKMVINVGFDGSYSIKEGEEADELRWVMYDIISGDSGAFWFWHYIKPLLFIVAGAGLTYAVKKMSSGSMWKSEKGKWLCTGGSVIVMVLAMVTALRIFG